MAGTKKTLRRGLVLSAGRAAFFEGSLIVNGRNA